MRILLVSHEASRTGAPRVAALVARSLVSRGHSVHILSRTRGPLLDDFAAEAPTRVEFLSRVRRRLRAVRWFPKRAAHLLDAGVALLTILAHRPDLVYVNSCAAGIYLAPARMLRRPVILHSHESGPVSERFLSDSGALGELPRVALIACSPSVRSELAEVASRPIAEVILVPSVPDDTRVRALADEDSDIRPAEGQLIVGCCGSVEHRKGADLWIEAAHRVKRGRPDLDIRFVWVGDIGADHIRDEDGVVEFLGPRANPYPLMRSFDIATLPSRDDPFPLVVLEAMLLGRPVVAFKVGAVADQLGSTGVLIDPGDVEAFAEAVVGLADDPQRRRIVGALAQRRAEDCYSTIGFSSRIEKVVLNRGANVLS